MFEKYLANAACEKAINHIVEGDKNALSVIYDLMHKQIYAIAWSILRNNSDAEDVLQETLYEIVKCAKGYKEGNAKAWILAIARNQALKNLNSRNRNISIESLENDIHFSIPQRTLTDSLESFEALASLAQEEREIVTLKVYGGLKHKEIAEIMGISVSASEQKYHRALQKLKVYYK